MPNEKTQETALWNKKLVYRKAPKGSKITAIAAKY